MSTNRWIPFLRVLITILLILLISNEMFKYMSNKLNLSDIRQVPVAVYLFLHHLAYVFLGFFMYRLVEKRNWDDLGLRINTSAKIITLWSLMILIGLYLLLILLTTRFELATWKLTSSISMQYVLQAVLIRGIMVGAGEEILFRGYLYKTLSSYGKVFAYSVSVLIFTGWHFLNGRFDLLIFLGLIVVSILFTYIYDCTGSIWPSFILHGAMDLLATLVTWNLKEVSLVYLFWKANTDKMIYTFKWFNLIVPIVLLVFVWLFFKYQKKKNPFPST